jgi:hypothetical protein
MTAARWLFRLERQCRSRWNSRERKDRTFNWFFPMKTMLFLTLAGMFASGTFEKSEATSSISA